MKIGFSFFHRGSLDYLINKINSEFSTNRNDRNIIINIDRDFFCPPEVIAPFAGIFDHLKTIGYSVKVNIEDEKNPLTVSGINEPFVVQNNEYQLLSPMFKVWKYNSPEEVSTIVNAFVKYLNTRVICAKGVVESFEWTLYEVMDNVLQHSQSSYGYVVCTATGNAHISVAVYDNGIGILQSFKNSSYLLKTPYDAIILAMKEGATRDKRIGQGNGLWGMSKLVSNNRGTLNIVSSGAGVEINENNKINKRDAKSILRIRPAFTIGTLVDFQFQCNNEVSLQNVFGNDYIYTNLNLESMEDDKNRIIIKVKEFSFGYATRLAGENARKLTINMVNQSTSNQMVVIDFDEINIISSSFADEFIGKLVQYYGFVHFNNLFKIINVGANNISIINRSVIQRMSEIN